VRHDGRRDDVHVGQAQAHLGLEALRQQREDGGGLRRAQMREDQGPGLGMFVLQDGYEPRRLQVGEVMEGASALRRQQSLQHLRRALAAHLCWLFSSSARRNIKYCRADELNSQHRWWIVASPP